jgi:hypothetical protein
MHIGFTIATLALTFLCAVHEGVTAEPETLPRREDASGQPRNHYERILQEIQELTARIHQEVDQVLEAYKRDTAEYHRRMGAKGGIIIRSDENPVDGIKAPPTTTATTPPSPKPDESGDELGNLKFKEIEGDFETYKTDLSPQLKHKIIMDLNHLMLSGELGDDEREKAIKIAESLNAHNLKVRLDAYHQPQDMGDLDKLPPEMLGRIINEVLKGGSVEDIKTLLHTSKGFNLDLLSSPTSLDLSPFYQKVTDQTLAQIVEIFPNMRSLNLWGCYKITDAGLEHLKDLTNLTELNLEQCLDITGAGLEHLKGLTKLTFLNLSHCYKITDAGLAHLKGLTRLTQLNLFNCQDITDAGLGACRT